MAKNKLNNIFLSASIPSPDRDKKYFETADIIAIRDAVRALATVVIPNSNLIWGGHPSITPLITYMLDVLKVNVKEHVTLYQSLYFREIFPKENEFVENVIFTDKYDSLLESINHMRDRMIKENEFVAGVFIGGMKGVEDEYRLFKSNHPNALIIPVSSTGAGAKIIYEKYENELTKRLKNDYSYMALFNDLLKNYI